MKKSKQAATKSDDSDAGLATMGGVAAGAAVGSVLGPLGAAVGAIAGGVAAKSAVEHPEATQAIAKKAGSIAKSAATTVTTAVSKGAKAVRGAKSKPPKKVSAKSKSQRAK